MLASSLEFLRKFLRNETRLKIEHTKFKKTYQNNNFLRGCPKGELSLVMDTCGSYGSFVDSMWSQRMSLGRELRRFRSDVEVRDVACYEVCS